MIITEFKEHGFGGVPMRQLRGSGVAQSVLEGIEDNAPWAINQHQDL